MTATVCVDRRLQRASKLRSIRQESPPAPFPHLLLERQTWNDDPQPQDLVTLGLLKTNPRFSRPS